MMSPQRVTLEITPNPQLELPEVQKLLLYWMIAPRPNPALVLQDCPVVFKILSETDMLLIAMMPKETPVIEAYYKLIVSLATKKTEKLRVLSALMLPISIIFWT